jgi:hypothetical protein
VRTVPATPDLIPFLLARMGQARAAAIREYCGGDPVAAITGNIDASFPTWCGLDDAGVVTMGGVMPIAAVPGSGYVWQYVADVAGHKRAYVLQSRAMLALALVQYDRLISIIEPSYPAALRHIRRLGFTVFPPVDFNGHPGCLCERTR